MSFIFIRCELCGELLASADADTLRRPMRGFMFKSPDQWHGVPAPFALLTEWVDMRCPYGNHRPFMNEDSVLLDSGDTWPVEYPDPPKPLEEEDDRWKPMPCEVCGRVIKGPGPMASHMRSHQ